MEDKSHESYIEHNSVAVLIMVMGAVISGITELAYKRYIATPH